MSLRLLAMAFYTPVACAVSLWRPFWGLLALVAMYYFRPDIWNAPDWFRPVMWITASIFIGWLLHARTLRFPPIMVVTSLALVGMVVSSQLAVDSRVVATDMLLIIAKLIVVQFLVIQLVDTPTRVRQFLWATVVGMLWNLKTILWEGLSGGDLEQAVRVDVGVGQGGGANYLAMVLVMSLPFFLMMLQNGSRRERRVAMVLAPLYVLCIVLTGSRGGLLALGIVGAYVFLRSNRKVLAASMVVAGVLIVVVAMPTGTWERFKRGLGPEEQRDQSAQSRLQLWGASIRMFKEYPLAGVGQDNFQLLSPRYVGYYAGRTARPYEPGVRKRGFVAHSTWFQTLAEGGLLVTVPFLALFAMSFLALRRSRRLPIPPPEGRQMFAMSVALEGMLIGFMVASTFGSHMKSDFMWWMFGLAAAMQMIARRLALRARMARLEAAAARRPEPALVGGPAGDRAW